jgi:hypothetical protein
MALHTRLLRVLAVLALAMGSCDGEPEHCRHDPDCGGGVGGFCDGAGDCDEGLCCTSGNCGGGMCTYECHDDRDCPQDMLCEHDTCFFACDDDRDCAEGQSCEHGSTICEWENDD